MADQKIVPFYAMKLRDTVAPRCRITASCWGCKRTAEIDIIDLIHRFGPWISLSKLQTKTIRCTACRSMTDSLKVEWL